VSTEYQAAGDETNGKGVSAVSKDEDVRKDDEEEVIEVITHGDEEDEWEEADPQPKARRGVDIIGDRPIRKAPPQESPGCLYSFLLLLVGMAVGWLAYYAIEVQFKGVAEEEGNQARILQATGEMRKLADAELQDAYKLASEMNYGVALVELKRVDTYYGILGKLNEGKPDDKATTVNEIVRRLETAKPEAQAEAREMLRKLVGAPADEPTTESGAQAAKAASTESAPAAANESAPPKDAPKAAEAAKDAAPAPTAAKAPSRPTVQAVTPAPPAGG
jgi:hypothetical protein